MRTSVSQLLCVVVIMGLSTHLQAQVFSNKEVGKKNQELADSLKQSEYPYVLPIWGEQATKAGFDLPYSAGISTQYFGQRSDLIIENLMVGFNHGEMFDCDEIIRFDKAKSQSDGISFRPDIWLFPFLNVYAILGRSQASTDVGWGLWLPDSTGAAQMVFRQDTKVEFTANTFGFGLTPTIGVGGGFLALDMNMTWTDVPQLDEPAFAFVFGPRLGKSFKLKKPGSSAQTLGGRLPLQDQHRHHGQHSVVRCAARGGMGEQHRRGPAERFAISTCRSRPGGTTCPAWSRPTR